MGGLLIEHHAKINKYVSRFTKTLSFKIWRFQYYFKIIFRIINTLCLAHFFIVFDISYHFDLSAWSSSELGLLGSLKSGSFVQLLIPFRNGHIRIDLYG